MKVKRKAAFFPLKPRIAGENRSILASAILDILKRFRYNEYNRLQDVFPMAIRDRIRLICNLQGMAQNDPGTLVRFPEKMEGASMLQYHRTTESEKYEIGSWKYEGAYSIYDSTPYEDQRKSGKGLANPRNNLFSFYDGENLVGYINLFEEASEVFLGIAANPAFCNQGYGQKMTHAAYEIARELFGNKPLYLEVRTWNKRAVRCYEKAGFHIDGEAFTQKTAIGEGSFYRMVKPAAFFHGSVVGGLNRILANARSHADGSKVAYFTTDRVYALVCCRSKEENFVTMGPRDGVQNYFERFPDQLKTMYEGKEGFIYQPVSSVNLKNTKGHTWESSVDVPVVLAEHIPNVYAEILREEAAGNVVIHRYAEIDPAEQKLHANYIKAHINDEGKEMEQFYSSHFSSLWD
jgi:RimJ/RimL family protein N-acetyltransferase